MSLVPDYGDSTSSSDNEEEEFPEIKSYDNNYKTNHINDKILKHTKSLSNSIKKNSTTLPSASIILSSNIKVNKGVVFNNPYKDAENEKIASLEKHVKMVATKEHTQIKNGKKICWNYRKGRCRFGSNCTFAHDSDLHEKHNSQFEIEANSQQISQLDSNCSASTLSPPQKLTGNEKIKKRPGLGDSIVPSKKVMKHYNRTNTVTK